MQGVEQAKAMVEADRSRLQKAKDELATQLRLAQSRARCGMLRKIFWMQVDV